MASVHAATDGLAMACLMHLRKYQVAWMNWDIARFQLYLSRKLDFAFTLPQTIHRKDLAIHLILGVFLVVFSFEAKASISVLTL